MASYANIAWEKEENQSQYKGFPREVVGKEYAKASVGQNSVLVGIP